MLPFRHEARTIDPEMRRLQLRILVGQSEVNAQRLAPKEDFEQVDCEGNLWKSGVTQTLDQACRNPGRMTKRGQVLQKNILSQYSSSLFHVIFSIENQWTVLKSCVGEPLTNLANALVAVSDNHSYIPSYRLEGSSTRQKKHPKVSEKPYSYQQRRTPAAPEEAIVLLLLVQPSQTRHPLSTWIARPPAAIWQVVQTNQRKNTLNWGTIEQVPHHLMSRI